MKSDNSKTKKKISLLIKLLKSFLIVFMVKDNRFESSGNNVNKTETILKYIRNS